MLTNISDDSTIIHNPVFERAVVKLQGGCKKDLAATEKRQIGRFKTSEDDDEARSGPQQLKVSPGTVRRCCWMSSEENAPPCCNRPDKYRLTKLIGFNNQFQLIEACLSISISCYCISINY
jgi:hypothetical protein